MKKKKIFISYRRDRADAFSELLYRELKKHYLVFMDKHSIGSGEFSKTLERAIIKSDVFLLVLSEKALHYRKPQDVFRQEIQCALAHKKRIIPLILKDFKYPEDSNGFDEEIEKIQGKEDFEFLDYDYFDVKVEDLRRRLIDQKDDELFFYNGTVAEKEMVPKGEKTKARNDNLLYGAIFFILLAVLLFLAAGILSFFFFEDLIGGQQETETQGQTVLETDPDTTEHQDTDIITDESVINTEECTESDTFESTGNNGETTAESTEHDSEKETVEQDKYRIYATGFFGETSNRFYNETFSFEAITNAPYIKVFLISKSGKWTLLTGAFVNTDFEYRTQGNSTWINTSHIAFVPCDKYGNEIRDSAIIIETSISWRENPLQNAKFKKDFYEIRRGETLKVFWTAPEYEELDIYYCLGIYKEEHGGSPLFYEDRIFRTYFVLDEEVTLELEPGEYYLRLFTVDQSDVYLSWYTMVELIVD